MTIDIAYLRAKLAAATPRPWHQGAHYIGAGGEPHNPAVIVGSLGALDDATLIVAAVNALPALLDEVERLREATSDLVERELHHFEVEQENARLRASIQEALHGGPREPGGFVMTETPRRILAAALEAARQAGGAS